MKKTIAHTVGMIAPVLVAMGVASTAAPTAAQDTGDLSMLRQEALDLTNTARTEAGLPELGPSALLDQVAQEHAVDMLERGYFDHVSPEGETPFERFLAAEGERWGVSGENIASCDGCPTPPDTSRLRSFHHGWMQSPGHRDNILSEGFDSFGFGIAGEGAEIYAVQTFSGPGADADGTDDARSLTPEAAQDLAHDEINAARTQANHDPLTRSDALEIVAARVLEQLGDDPGTLPDDVFGLLPEGSTGWTSLALQSASLGGTGSSLTQSNIIAIISDWAAATEADRSLGGGTATHLGFAAEAAGDGRTSAVAVFGGQD